MKKARISIFIEKSKTDVYPEDCWMHFSKLQSALCPIKLFKKYIKAAKNKESEEKFIFRQISNSKQGLKLKDLDKRAKVKHELRVQIHELRVQINDLRVQIYDLRVQITSWEIKSTS